MLGNGDTPLAAADLLRQLVYLPQASVLVAEARRGPYDLIVMGAHHAEGWRQILLTDVTRQVLAEAPLPVLIVR